jgi:hypothetical protein
MNAGLSLGIDRQRAYKRQTVHEADEVVGAGGIWSRSQPRKPGLLDGWVDQQKGFELLHLVYREPIQKNGFGPLPGNGTAGKADLLESRVGQEKSSAAAQLVHGRGHDGQAAFGRAGGFGSCEKGCSTIISRRGPDAEVFRQAVTVFKPRWDAARIGCKNLRGYPSCSAT